MRKKNCDTSGLKTCCVCVCVCHLHLLKLSDMFDQIDNSFRVTVFVIVP